MFVCFNDVKLKRIWKILFYEAQVNNRFERFWMSYRKIAHWYWCSYQHREGLIVFIPLYNSLYIKYNSPIVYSCNIIVGNKWVLDGLDPVVVFWIRQKQHYQWLGSNWSGLDWSPNRWLFWGSGEVGRKSRSRESKYPIKDVYTNGKLSFVLVSVVFLP